MDKESIIKLINTKIQNQSLEVGSLSTSSHTHNGADSPLVMIENVSIRPNIGIPFINDIYQYNMFIDGVDYSLAIIPNLATINSNNAVFYLGTVGSPFFDIYIAAENLIITSIMDVSGSNVFFDSSTGSSQAITDGTGSATEQLTPTIKSWTATGDFALKLPVSTQPAAVTGMLSFNGTSFLASPAATFQYIPTSDGTTGIGTVPSGTIDIIINGITYHLLHT